MDVSRTARTFLVTALLVAFPASASGGATHGPTAKRAGKPPARIVFPIVGEAAFRDDFGEPRGQGGHEANDIMAERRAPVVAVEDGKVRFWTTSSRAGCMLYLYGASGTTYYYIHLNNDLGPGNDNRGKCEPGTAYAPGLKDGQAVVAGQLVGYVGDSGDADGLHPHLHFELRPGDGSAVSPYRWLKRAVRLPSPDEPTLAAGVELAITGRVKKVSKGPDARITIEATRCVVSRGRSFVLSRELVFKPATRPVVQRLEAGGSSAAGFSRIRPGDRVTVTTVLEQPAAPSQIAAPGGLAADAVVVAPRR